MKKVISLFSLLLLVFSLFACSPQLSEAQKECCNKVDELFVSMAEDLDLKFDSKMDKKGGKILYVATLDFDGDLTDSNAKTFQQSVMPVAEKILGKEDIYFVLYLNENGQEVYRLIDSRLNPNLLD